MPNEKTIDITDPAVPLTELNHYYRQVDTQMEYHATQAEQFRQQKLMLRHEIAKRENDLKGNVLKVQENEQPAAIEGKGQAEEVETEVA